TLPGCNWVTTPGLTGTHLTDGWAVYCPQQEPYHWTGYYAKIVDGASSSTFSVGEHYGSEDVLGRGDYYWTQWLGDGTLYIQSGCSVVSQDGNCTNTDGVCHPDPGCSVNDRIQNCMGSNCWYVQIITMRSIGAVELKATPVAIPVQRANRRANRRARHP